MFMMLPIDLVATVLLSGLAAMGVQGLGVSHHAAFTGCAIGAIVVWAIWRLFRLYLRNVA
jgi:hypothetical protein